MVATAADVAAELRRRIPGLPTTKLHKLLYYCQGHHLASLGKPMFEDGVVAFDLGPVVSRLWWQERENGPVTGTTLTDEGALNTIGFVVFRYGRLTTRDLVNLTHSESPWRRADENRSPGTSARIERAWMLDYFAADADDSEAVDTTLDAADVAAWLGPADRGPDRDLEPDSLEELRRRAGVG